MLELNREELKIYEVKYRGMKSEVEAKNEKEAREKVANALKLNIKKILKF
jgi:hypothetical protein